MKVIQTADNRTISKVTICCMIAVIILAIILGIYLIKTSKFQEVEAQIAGMETKVYDRPGDEQITKKHVVYYKYIYNNEEYLTEEQVFTKMGKKRGDVIKIKCNPENPKEIKSSTFIISICSVIGCALLFSFLINLVKIKKFILERKEQMES